MAGQSWYRPQTRALHHPFGVIVSVFECIDPRRHCAPAVHIVVEVMEIVGNTVRLGVQAPRSVPVYREELWDAIRTENQAAAFAAPAELAGPLPRPVR